MIKWKSETRSWLFGLFGVWKMKLDYYSNINYKPIQNGQEIAAAATGKASRMEIQTVEQARHSWLTGPSQRMVTALALAGARGGCAITVHRSVCRACLQDPCYCFCIFFIVQSPSCRQVVLRDSCNERRHAATGTCEGIAAVANVF